MPGYKALVDLLSFGTAPDASVGSPGTPGVVDRLKSAGIQVPTEFRILLGIQHLREMSAPPRIVFVPTASEFKPRYPGNRSPVGNGRTNPSDEMRLQQESRSIRTDSKEFAVHCWGQGEPADPDANDYDFTEYLYNCVIQTVHALVPGHYHLGAGKWNNDTRVMKAGALFTFSLSIDTPVLDTLSAPALRRAPTNTSVSEGIFFQPINPATPPEIAVQLSAP